MSAEALASGWPVRAVVVQADRLELAATVPAAVPCFSLDPVPFAALSTHEQPEGILAVVGLPPHFPAGPGPLTALPAGPGFILDDLQDPGNLGTLLRTADWLGLPDIILGRDCVDPLNPKTLRASMGSLFRVRLHWADSLAALLLSAPGRAWLATMDGPPAPQVRPGPRDFIVLGNEARGLSPTLAALPGLPRISIPGRGGAESLNVAMAGGILAWHLRQGG